MIADYIVYGTGSAVPLMLVMAESAERACAASRRWLPVKQYPTLFAERVDPENTAHTAAVYALRANDAFARLGLGRAYVFFDVEDDACGSVSPTTPPSTGPSAPS